MPSNVSDEITPERFSNAEDGAVFGRVEALNDTVVAGWICIKGATGTPELTLDIGGERLGLCQHLNRRTDVAAVAGGADAFGFSFRLPKRDWHSYALLHSSAKVTTSTGVEIQKMFANTDTPNVSGRDDRTRSSFTSADRPLVSVIIPVYDRVQLLRESINSILEQTYN